MDSNQRTFQQKTGPNQPKNSLNNTNQRYYVIPHDETSAYFGIAQDGGFKVFGGGKQGTKSAKQTISDELSAESNSRFQVKNQDELIELHTKTVSVPQQAKLSFYTLALGGYIDHGVPQTYHKANQSYVEIKGILKLDKSLLKQIYAKTISLGENVDLESLNFSVKQSFCQMLQDTIRKLSSVNYTSLMECSLTAQELKEIIQKAPKSTGRDSYIRQEKESKLKENASKETDSAIQTINLFNILNQETLIALLKFIRSLEPKESGGTQDTEGLEKVQSFQYGITAFPFEYANAFSNEQILLNGMKVIFDQAVGVYPVTLESKGEASRNGTRN